MIGYSIPQDTFKHIKLLSFHKPSYPPPSFVDPCPPNLSSIDGTLLAISRANLQ